MVATCGRTLPLPKEKKTRKEAILLKSIVFLNWHRCCIKRDDIIIEGSREVLMDNIFGMHEAALKIRSQRTELLASNLVNSDTPGYKAKDLDFKQALSEFYSSNKASLVCTNEHHMNAGLKLLEAAIFDVVPITETKDGNTVNPFIENSKLAENHLRHATSLRIIEHKIQEIMTAIRGE